MGRNLEQRRRAIAAALRAVMAEPLPAPPASAPTVVAPTVETVEFHAPPEPDHMSADRPSLRDALTADVDWGEDAEDWESPSVPPIDTAGSMSEVASMALFGHA